MFALLVLCVACSNGADRKNDIDAPDIGDTSDTDDANTGDTDDTGAGDTGDTDNTEVVDDWPTAARLVVDGLANELRVDEYSPLSIARIVGDDLYVEVQWSITNPENGRIRVGLRIEGAGTQDVSASLAEDRVEVFGVEHFHMSPLMWARLFDNDPRATGRVRVQHADGKTTLSLELSASLTALGAQPREPLAVELEDRVEMEAVPRAVYAGGTCSSEPQAFYIPLQVGEYEVSFYDWEAVERDCQRNQTTGCGQTGAGECGDGDRWLCYLCFADACVQPAWVSECFPR